MMFLLLGLRGSVASQMLRNQASAALAAFLGTADVGAGRLQARCLRRGADRVGSRRQVIPGRCGDRAAWG